jgi:hypothetical protein
MAVDVSEGTIARIERMFSAADRPAVVDVLVHQCGNNLPFGEAGTPTSLERIRFAVLKLSEGDITKLLSAVHHAQIDWRDVLVWAGFGNDTRAHLGWWPDATHTSRPE